MPAKGWVLQDSDDGVATGHGSLQLYDRQVPVIVLPPGRTAHPALAAPDTTTIAMARIAPMLAEWLGVPPPSALQPSTSP
jgi:hypothetical protein